jgi:hypothetical protein
LPFLPEKPRFQVRLPRFCRKNDNFKSNFPVFGARTEILNPAFFVPCVKNYFFQAEPELFTGERFSLARKLKSQVRILHFWSKKGNLRSRLTIYCPWEWQLLASQNVIML